MRISIRYKATTLLHAESDFEPDHISKADSVLRHSNLELTQNLTEPGKTH